MVPRNLKAPKQSFFLMGPRGSGGVYRMFICKLVEAYYVDDMSCLETSGR